MKYYGIFNKVISKEDVIIRAQLVNPSLDNFFGFGNESVYDKTKPLNFYRVRYKFIEVDALLRKRFPDDRYVGIELEVNQRFVLAGGAPWAKLQQTIVESLAASL